MIETPRLLLRQWRDEDRDPWRAMNADPAVMEHFPSTLDAERADWLMERHRRLLTDTGLGFWAVERREGGAFLGFAGLNLVGDGGPMHGRWEVGWRFAQHAWGHGYASEAGAASLAHGHAHGMAEIVSFTASTNARSEAVMRRIGMRRAPEQDFDHPALPEGHRLRRHIVYLSP